MDAPSPHPEGGGSFVWTIRPEQIRAEAVARHLNTAAIAKRKAAISPWEMGGVLALCVVLGAFLFLQGPPIRLPFVFSVIVVVCATPPVVWQLNRNVRRRVAGILRRNADRVGPSTFVAGPAGFHATDVPSSGTDQGWGYYRSVDVADDQILLTTRSGHIRVLPNEALVSGQSPADGIAALQAWIDLADPRQDE